MWLIIRQLSLKAGWWDALLSFQDLAERICLILPMWSSPFCFHGGSLAIKIMPLLPTHLLCFPSESISNRFPHRHYQEIWPSHNGSPTKTHFAVPTLSHRCFHFTPESLLIFARHTSIQLIKCLWKLNNGSRSWNSPLPETSPGDKWPQSLVTNFLNFIPRYESNHHKQQLLITTSKISIRLPQLQIRKSK